MNLDWSILIEGNTPERILGGLAITVQLAIFSLGLALVLGIFLALARFVKWPVIGTAATIVVDFVRSTPPLVQLLFWYFGASFIFPEPFYRWLVDHNLKFSVAVIGLGIYTSAFIAEVLRSGVQSLPRGQLEAAFSVGLTQLQGSRYVIFPQVLRIVTLPMINEFLSLTKNTSLAVAIGVAELSFVATSLQDRTFRVIEVFTAITIIYLLLSLTITFTSKLAARRLKLDYSHEEPRGI